MSLFRRILVAFIAIGAVSIIFLAWYSVQHARDEAITTRYLPLEPVKKVLVAADQIDVRDSLIRKVIRGLQVENITIEVYKLSDLAVIDENEWSAIVVFRKASRSNTPGDKVNQIKSFSNGFLVTVNGSRSYTLEGGTIKAPDQLSGIDTSAIHIVDKVQYAVHAKM